MQGILEYYYLSFLFIIPGYPGGLLAVLVGVPFIFFLFFCLFLLKEEILLLGYYIKFF